jgi:hypothetical protein
MVQFKNSPDKYKTSGILTGGVLNVCFPYPWKNKDKNEFSIYEAPETFQHNFI